MNEKELHDHLNWKTLHIHALGNAVSDSSLGHLLSYVNDSDSHIALRSSAVNALAKYNQKQVRVVCHLVEVLSNIAQGISVTLNTLLLSSFCCLHRNTILFTQK